MLNNPFQQKKIIILLLIIMLLTNACAPTESPQAATEITFSVFGDPAELDAYRALVEAFHEQNAEIRVNLQVVPSQAEYRKRLAVDLAAGTPPDVFLLNYRRFAQFIQYDALEPVDSYLAQSEIIAKEDFYPIAIEAFIWQGELICLPQNVSSLVVYYNKDLFDQAGIPYPNDDWNLVEFLETAKALTNDTNGDGRIDQYGLGTDASLFRVAPFIWSNGGELVNDPDAPTTLTLTQQAALEAVTWFVNLQVVEKVVPSAEEEAAQDSESRFLNGTLGMYLNSRRGVPTYRLIENFDWDVAPLPISKTRAGILHSDGYCMAAAAENKEAVWKFVEYANSPAGQEIVSRSGRTVPSLISVAESDAFLAPDAKPANSRIFLDTLPYARRVPLMENWVDVEEIAGEEIERAFFEHAPVLTALDAAQDRTLIYFPEETALPVSSEATQTPAAPNFDQIPIGEATLLSAADHTDEEGNLFIIGEVENTGQYTLGTINTQITLEDENGGFLLIQATKAYPENLGPGQKAAFMATFPQPLGEWKNYKINISALPVEAQNPTIYEGLQIEESDITVPDDYTLSSVNGSIINAGGETAHRIQLYITLYDEEGQITGLLQHSFDESLAQNATLKFDLPFKFVIKSPFNYAIMVKSDKKLE